MREEKSVMNNAAAIVCAAGLAVAGAAHAGATIPVNSNLGAISGVTNISGDTALGQNSVDIYDGLTSSAGNWANEFVYEFTVSDFARLDVTLNAESSDTDFFLLNGLNIGVDGISGKNTALNGLGSVFVDGGIPDTGSFGVILPGTYWLSVETFAGFDPPPGPFTSTFDADLNLVTGTGAPAPTDFIDLGAIANEFEPIAIDSNGSDFDTELGLWSNGGLLLDTDDDGGDGLQSLLDVPSGLPAGDYWVGLGEFNTTYEDGFVLNPGDSGGDWILNYNGQSTSGVLAEGAGQFFRFTVVPTPGAASLLALGGLAAVRRRR
jgi:hypothetical protein